jgi:hypothetical protein
MELVLSARDGALLAVAPKSQLRARDSTGDPLVGLVAVPNVAGAGPSNSNWQCLSAYAVRTVTPPRK